MGHIIGKVYEINKNNFNKLIQELDNEKEKNLELVNLLKDIENELSLILLLDENMADAWDTVNKIRIIIKDLEL